MWLLTGQGEGVSHAEEVEDLETLELLGELREIRLAHAKLLERMARVEKRLRMQTSGA